MSKESKQVVIASSMIPMDVNDISLGWKPQSMFLIVAKSLTGKEGMPPR